MNSALQRLETALSAAVLGQPKVVADLVTVFLARGHVLLEGVPGVAKTLLARCVASALGLEFKRVQFTPDLMPSDVLGTSVFRPGDATFQLVKGPIFTDVLVADEVNRTPPKTQAALLEAMEERQVSLDGKTHALPAHFFVVATQNPLELEGTWPLPEAQLDRFMMRVKVGYPAAESEVAMLSRFHERGGKNPEVARVLSLEELTALQAIAAGVRTEATVIDYVVRLTRATRESAKVKLGASPRAAQAWLSAAKARAALLGKDFVTPDEVKEVAAGVLNHRLQLKAEAEVEGVTAEDVVRATLERVPVTR